MEMLMGYIRAIHKLYRHNVDQLIEKYEVYPGQPPALLKIAEQDGIIQRQLADYLQVTAPTLSVMLKRMEKSGLIERRPDERDHRSVRVYLTAKGKEASGAVRVALQVVDEKMVANFTAEEREMIHRLLQTMKTNLIS